MTADLGLAGLLRAERHATIELLDSLEPAAWQVPSLCAGWTVRDVAAHLAYAPVLSPLAMAAGVARAGLRVNRFVRDSAVLWAREHDTCELVGQLRENARTGAVPAGVPPLAPLSDAVVHGLDMRVPLDSPRAVPAEVFRRLADWHADLRWPGTAMVGGAVRARTAGVRLVCEDAEWEHGEGPEARATAATILLLLTGRPVGPDDLAGPGAEELRARC